MSDEKSEPIKRSKTIKRRFYDMCPNYRLGGRPGFVMENANVLAPDTGVLESPPGQGFPNYPEPPRFLFDKKIGVAPLDMELFHYYWLVSDRMKVLFEAVDPTGFAFVACDIRVPQGHYTGPPYWLCNVVRVLDAVDETRSRLKVGIVDDPMYRDFGLKYYSTLVPGGAKLVFRENVVASAHVFRMAHMDATIICDQVLKDACKTAGVKGILFRDASHL
ncbi:DUF1629 domain-containing protein [Bradyrhizobium sp. CIAT3101]|uniref:imm11 family protein n=1 Tax=Bradyrhizobium sp. CIAT3101 TaxID=439387 RepID=UPI0024B102B4|nr:DUF1629 domain-containing protein [Bradyrhizobium sp. CIAT3101]WFU83769.1 DUF1629 domain-containing protein [Bradyrhizobium sp. CIAT3101]